MKRRSGASRTEAGQSNKSNESNKSNSNSRQDNAGQSGPDLIDAINQIFAEFELAYHNQYHKAYGDPERLVLTKKYWLECLADFYPQQLVLAARQLVKTQEYLPTISSLIKACEQGNDLFGLPALRDAYTKACRAPAPKAAFDWSHPAVYHAGKATDWFVLATEPEDKVFPLFSYYYKQLCERVMRGESLHEPVPPALADKPSRPLSFAERDERLQTLRRHLKV